MHLTEAPCPLGAPDEALALAVPMYKYFPPELAVSELQKYPRWPTKVNPPLVLLLYPPAGSFRLLAYADAGLLTVSVPIRLVQSACDGIFHPGPIALQESAPLAEVTEAAFDADH